MSAKLTATKKHITKEKVNERKETLINNLLSGAEDMWIHDVKKETVAKHMSQSMKEMAAKEEGKDDLFLYLALSLMEAHLDPDISGERTEKDNWGMRYQDEAEVWNME